MTRERTAALVGAVAVLTVVGVLTGGVGASPTADSASPHGAENGNYTVDFPFNTDHYPRDENPGGEYNASVNQFAAGTQESYNDQGAPDGLEQMKYLKIENQDIDFSECSSSNTAAFGIDRDNDASGTEVDLDLLRYLEQSKFNDHSIEVDFYEGDELGAPNPPDRGGKEAGREDGDSNAELYPDDEIVSHQGYRSGGGPCYGMPEEPGWYQIEGFTNGTSFSGSEARIETISHYFYICVCDSEEEAREQLGPPPSEDGSTDDSTEQTATATETATATPGDTGSTEETATATGTATPTPTETATATPTETATPTPTAEPGDGGGGGDDGGSSSGDSGDGGSSDSGDNASQGTATATAGGSDGGQANQQQNQQQAQQEGAGPATPTVGAGPGFGAVAALAGALLTGLLALRRR